MNWKGKIVIEIEPKVVDYTDMPECEGRIGFPTNVRYGGFRYGSVEGIHTIQQLEDLFSDIIIDLQATLDEYPSLEPTKKTEETING